MTDTAVDAGPAAELVGPITLGAADKQVVVAARMTHVAYHHLLAAMGSGRIGTDDSVPGDVAGDALRLYMLRRPTTPIRNQWMDWERSLTEDGWRERLSDQIKDYGEQVTDTIGRAGAWFAEQRWPRLRRQLDAVLGTLVELRTAVADTIPVLERVSRSALGPLTPVFVLPRRSFRIPVAFDKPLAMDLRGDLTPTAVKLLELLVHQLFHELATTSYLGGTSNLLHVLDTALKRYSAHDASLDVWHSVAHFGAGDLACRALRQPRRSVPGDRDVANTRRLFTDPEPVAAWQGYVEESIDAEEFADRIARAVVRTNV